MAVEDDRKVVFGGIRGGCGGVLSPDSAGCVEASRCKDRFGGGWMKGDGTDGAFVAGVKGRERGVGAEGEDVEVRSEEAVARMGRVGCG